jgi:hypothetical protein
MYANFRAFFSVALLHSLSTFVGMLFFPFPSSYIHIPSPITWLRYVKKEKVESSNVTDEMACGMMTVQKKIYPFSSLLSRYTFFHALKIMESMLNEKDLR